MWVGRASEVCLVSTALVSLQTGLCPHFLLCPRALQQAPTTHLFKLRRCFWGKHYAGSALEVSLLTQSLV